MPKKEIVEDAVTGEKVVLDAMTGKPVTDETKGATGGHSFFEDDEGENLSSGFVQLDGVNVKVLELTAAEMASYAKGEREVNELMAALGSADSIEAVEKQTEIIQAKQAEIYDAVIARAVSKWELTRPDGTPVPCTLESKKRLRISKKAELSDKIVQRSRIGRDLSVFLDRS